MCTGCNYMTSMNLFYLHFNLLKFNNPLITEFNNLTLGSCESSPVFYYLALIVLISMLLLLWF